MPIPRPTTSCTDSAATSAAAERTTASSAPSCRRPARGRRPPVADPAWPPQEGRRLLGKDVERLDGPAKVSGAAKYSFDVNRPRTLHARLLRCPHARAKLTK